MPRKPRIEYAGAVYHVLSRGNRREEIFRDDPDRGCFLETLGQACGRTGWRVHAFVLMGNHYHLLLETPEPNLVAGMKWLQGTYTQRFNIRHRVSGHLFQGRYKALSVDAASDPEYFGVVSTYIHLNPARARLFDLKAGRLGDFTWSSFPSYIRPSVRPEWLEVDRVLASHGMPDTPRGRRAYRERMRKRVLEIEASDRPWEVDLRWGDIRRGWYLGPESFRDELLDRLQGAVKGKQRRSYSGKEMRLHDEREAERLLRIGLKKLSLPQRDLAALRKGAAEKMILSWYLKCRTTVSNEWIAQHLQSGHPANIPGYVRAVSAARQGPLADLKEILKSED
jgi:REP element-mobilizing transposase RayT